MYCSIFGPIMETYEGDLADIVRSGTTVTSSSSSSSSDHWQFSCSDPLTNFSPVMEDPILDPFPLHHHHHDHRHHHVPATSDSYFDTTNSSDQVLISTSSGRMQEAAGLGLDGTATTSCDNIFSNLIQISPNAKLPVSPPCDSPATTPIAVLPDTSMDCGLQISSSHNLGFKRRKSVVKKVVCIPAPAVANSRSSGGEVVPSDLWAWRKYGQKPIKGSPYPRGYYRCSSSKGCSARKQVERSRTDPNMLVITYTSEHNHPWPTQRNVLAGSSRSHKPKTSINSININSEPTNHLPQEGINNNNNTAFPPVVEDGSSAKSTARVKQEVEEDMTEVKKKEEEMVEDEMFAELGEIEADEYPPDLWLAQGFNNDGSKALDPIYDLFGW